MEMNQGTEMNVDFSLPCYVYQIVVDVPTTEHGKLTFCGAKVVKNAPIVDRLACR